MFPRLVPLALAAALHAAAATHAAMPRLEVSANNRYLVEEDGTPFFLLGDTGWEMFHRLDREEAQLYLENRAAKGFNTILAVGPGLGDFGDPNALGDPPFEDNDPSKPVEAYWEHVDYLVATANSLGMRIAFLPAWGNKWNLMRRGPVPLTPKNAEAYGVWLGQRYADAGVIWMVGGDRTVDNKRQDRIVRALARGLCEGDGGRSLITFHPRGGRSSSQYFHQDEWLDFNMIQSGHDRRSTNYTLVEHDYALDPPKPTLDGEPGYEYPADAMPPDRKRSHVGERQIRRNAYWAVFAGAFGHVYGCHPIWQMYEEGRTPSWSVSTPWQESLDLPGATQMIHLKRLMLSRPFLDRIPDQALLLDGPAENIRRVQITRDGTPGADDATYLMAYFPGPAPATLRTGAIAGETLRVWWYDPRTGEASLLGEMPRQDVTTFTPPQGDGPDWVVVVDDAAREYPPPGQAGM